MTVTRLFEDNTLNVTMDEKSKNNLFGRMDHEVELQNSCRQLLNKKGYKAKAERGIHYCSVRYGVYMMMFLDMGMAIEYRKFTKYKDVFDNALEQHRLKNRGFFGYTYEDVYRQVQNEQEKEEYEKENGVHFDSYSDYLKYITKKEYEEKIGKHFATYEDYIKDCFKKEEKVC